jgi:hypothetical protein
MGNNTASASQGEKAYIIKLEKANRIGGGTYADVYRIRKKDKNSNIMYAAKFLKVPMEYMDNLEKKGYDVELKILKDTNHPFVIKY